jgi:hypothetical protein
MSLAFQDWKILLLQPIIPVFLLEPPWEHINYDKSCHYPSSLLIYYCHE